MQEENLHDPLGCEGHDMSCAYGIACDVPCMESKKIQHVLDSWFQSKWVLQGWSRMCCAA